MVMLKRLNLDGRNWQHTASQTNYSFRPPPPRGTLRERTLLRVCPTREETLLGILKRENLGVASLSDALDGRPIRVVSPDSLGLPSTERSVYGNVYGNGNHDLRPAPALISPWSRGPNTPSM